MEMPGAFSGSDFIVSKHRNPSEEKKFKPWLTPMRLLVQLHMLQTSGPTSKNLSLH